MRNSFYLIILLINFFQFPFHTIFCSTPQINESILLTTDRKVYIAGENLLFSIFLIDKIDKKLASYPSIGYVILRNCNGTIVGKSQVKINSGRANNAIYLEDTLQTGYYQLTAYTNFMRNGEESNFYKSQIIIANRFDKNFIGLLQPSSGNSTKTKSENHISDIKPDNLSISTDKLGYRSHEKCKLRIKFNEMNRFAHLTISVVEKNKYETICPDNDFNETGKNLPGFRESVNQLNFPYLTEDLFAELRGRLIDKKGNPIKDKLIFITAPDSIVSLKYTFTNTKGYFRFPLSDDLIGKDLFIKYRKDSSDDNLQIQIDNKYSLNENFIPTPIDVDSSFISYLLNSQNIVRIQKYFNQNQRQETKINYNSTPNRLNIIPDAKVIPSDYQSIDNLFEISNEIIPGLKIKRNGNLYSAEVMDELRRQYFNQEPMIFLDGILMDDINQIIGLGTNEISRIELITSNWFINQLKFPGILSVFSNNQNWKTMNWNSNSIHVKTESFYTNLYKKNVELNPPYPDFRQLLFWEPDIEITSGNEISYEFYTPEEEGEYLIKISGLNDDCNPIKILTEFSVNND